MSAKSWLPGKSDRALVGRPVVQTSRSEVRLVDEPFGGRQGSMPMKSCEKAPVPEAADLPAGDAISRQ
jgi:hypothetical protein